MKGWGDMPDDGRSRLGRGLAALGGVALHSLMAEDGAQGVVHPLHHAPKAKRVIFLYQAGGPSHLETSPR